MSIAHLNGAPPVLPAGGTNGSVYQFGGFQGACIFFASDQESVFGSSLISLGWIDRGDPAGFGYPDSLALYCAYGKDATAAIELPPFHDFSDGSLGIHHGICTL